MLQPDEVLPLPDDTRVKLTIEPIREPSNLPAVAAWEAIQARLGERPLHFGGRRYTREELHVRR
jgi:hypothetical protein